MQTSIQTALEGAVTSLPPEQAVMLPDNLLAAFQRLPVAHRRAMLVASRLEVWVSMMTYDPAVASRYAFQMAGGRLPPAPSNARATSVGDIRSTWFKALRNWLADTLKAEPDQFAQIEQQVGTFILMNCKDTGRPPSTGRWVIQSQFGHYGMVALTRSPWSRRTGSSRHEIRRTSCLINPPTH